MNTDEAPSMAALRYYGGKWRLAPWYAQHFAPHRCFVDLFGGGANVILRKPRSAMEVYNDLDGNIVNVFRVIQNPAKCQQLFRRLKRTPYSRQAFVDAFEPTDDEIERAARVIIRSCFTSHPEFIFKEDKNGRHFSIRAHKDDRVKMWAKYPRALVEIQRRLRGVTIENKDALELIPLMDAPDALFFADPPYKAETRKGGASYGCEMTAEQHAALLDALTQAKGNAIVCGYDNPLYRQKLAGWQMATTKAYACLSATPRLECLWIKRQHGQQSLQLE